MLASASHELRSPLARLRVAVELMGAEARPELRSEAETDIAELDDMIEDLLVSASLESGERHLLSEPVDLLALLTEEGARVDAETTGASLVIQGDSRLLRRLIRNLFENARRHSSGSQVEAHLAPSPEGPGAQLTVADRGPGVPESEREHIFEPFYRLEGHSEGRHGGVGLGLALVREIARHHGGDVRCLARPEGGTCFEVTLRGVA
jgi:signal transduction histidine kinase